MLPVTNLTPFASDELVESPAPFGKRDIETTRYSKKTEKGKQKILTALCLDSHHEQDRVGSRTGHAPLEPALVRRARRRPHHQSPPVRRHALLRHQHCEALAGRDGQLLQRAIWTTFRQAKELGAHIRKGERGDLVVYADTITRTEQDDRGKKPNT